MSFLFFFLIFCLSINFISGLICNDETCILNCDNTNCTSLTSYTCTNTTTTSCIINCNQPLSCDNLIINTTHNTNLNCLTLNSCNSLIMNILTPINNININIKCKGNNACNSLSIISQTQTNILFNCSDIMSNNTCINNNIICGGINNECNAICDDILSCNSNIINCGSNNMCLDTFGWNLTNVEPFTTTVFVTTNKYIKPFKPNTFNEQLAYGYITTYNWIQNQSWLIIGLICGGFCIILSLLLFCCYYCQSKKTYKLVEKLSGQGLNPKEVQSMQNEIKRHSKKIENIEMVDADDFNDSSDSEQPPPPPGPPPNRAKSIVSQQNGNNNGQQYNPLLNNIDSDKNEKMSEIEKIKKEQEKAFNTDHAKKLRMLKDTKAALAILEKQNKSNDNDENSKKQNPGPPKDPIPDEIIRRYTQVDDPEEDISISLNADENDNINNNNNIKNDNEPNQSSALELFNVIPPMGVDISDDENDNQNDKVKSLRNIDNGAIIKQQTSSINIEDKQMAKKQKNLQRIDSNSQDEYDPFSGLSMPSNEFNNEPIAQQNSNNINNNNNNNNNEDDIIRGVDEDGILFGLMNHNKDVDDLNNITAGIDKPIEDFQEIDKSHIEHVEVPIEDQFKIVGQHEKLVITDDKGVSRQYVSTKKILDNGTNNLENTMNEAKKKNKINSDNDDNYDNIKHDNVLIEVNDDNFNQQSSNNNNNNDVLSSTLDNDPFANFNANESNNNNNNNDDSDSDDNEKVVVLNPLENMPPPPTGDVLPPELQDMQPFEYDSDSDKNDNNKDNNNNEKNKPNVVPNPIDDMPPPPTGNVLTPELEDPFANYDNYNNNPNDDTNSDDNLNTTQNNTNNKEISKEINNMSSPLDALMNESHKSPLDDIMNASAPEIDNNNNNIQNESDSEIDIHANKKPSIGDGGAQYNSPLNNNNSVGNYQSPLVDNKQYENQSSTDSSDDPEKDVKDFLKTNSNNNDNNENDEDSVSEAGTEVYNEDGGYGTDPNEYQPE